MNYSEIEVNRKYPDLLLIPKDKNKEYYSIMIQFKYLKKNEEKLVKEKKEEAKKQIEDYSNFEEIKSLGLIILILEIFMVRQAYHLTNW